MKRAPNIQIVDESSGERVWCGPLRDFFRANDMEAPERAFVCGTLRAGESVFYGGGAAAAYIISIEGRV